jgi:hypothetical protein
MLNSYTPVVTIKCRSAPSCAPDRTAFEPTIRGKLDNRMTWLESARDGGIGIGPAGTIE